MATLLEDFQAYLLSNGIGTGDGIDMFRDFVPDDPSSIIALIEYDSIPFPHRGDTAALRYVQVLVRDVNPDVARAKANQIYNKVMESNENIIYLTHSRWGLLMPKQCPFRISTDEKNQVLFGFNMSITTHID